MSERNVETIAGEARTSRGLAVMLLSVLGFSLMGILFRGGRDAIGPALAMFWRSATGLAVVVPWALRARSPLLGRRRGLLLLRGLAGALALLCFFIAADRIDLGTATALCYTYPFFASFLSAVFLGERVGVGGWAGIALAWAGIAVMAGFRPSFGAGEVYGIISGVLAGVAVHTVRAMRREGEAVTSILYWFFLVGALVALPLALREDPALGVTGGAIVRLVALGLAATVGQFALTLAYRDLPTRVGSPLSLLVVPLSMVGAYTVSGETPAAGALAGTVILAAGIAMIARSNAE